MLNTNGYNYSTECILRLLQRSKLSVYHDSPKTSRCKKNNKYLKDLYWQYIYLFYADMYDIQLCLVCLVTSYILIRNKLRMFNDIRFVDDNQLLLICLVYYSCNLTF